MKTVTLQITTHNRLKELIETLNLLKEVINDERVHTIICDDGSNDGTFEYINTHFPKFELFRNEKSIGLIGSRNKIMDLTKTEFAVSVDDDLNFLSISPIDSILNYFEKHPQCGVISFGIHWGLNIPTTIENKEASFRARNFAGGAHAFRMKAWYSIPNYPYWFKFYGEEEFASIHLFKHHWEINYVPSILTHHRVELKRRKLNNDYIFRQMRSFRAGIFILLMFYPFSKLPRLVGFAIYNQIKNKLFKGDWRATLGVVLGIFSIVINLNKVYKNSDRLSIQEYELYTQLKSATIYWYPSK